MHLLKCTKLYMALLLITISSLKISAKDLDNIAILPIQGFQGSNSKHYQEILTEKLLIKITQSNRFNVISRMELQDIIHEQKLQLSGLFDEATVTEVGRLAGVDFLVVGYFVGNQSKFYATEYSESGVKTRESFYHAKAEASLKLIELSSGKYLSAISVEESGFGRSKDEAILKCIENLSVVVFSEFEQTFAIQCNILNVSEGMIAIDAGETSGIKKGMGFFIVSESNNPDLLDLDMSSGGSRIGEAIVTEVGPRKAKARIISQKEQVTDDCRAFESKSGILLSGFVIKKQGTKVTINLGEDVGLISAQTFKLISEGESFTDPISGKEFIVKGTKLSIIVIDKVQSNTAHGKIIRGVGYIQEGARITQTNFPLKYAGFCVSTGISIIQSNANLNAGTKTVEGSNINYDYTGEDELPSLARILRISYFHKNWKHFTKFNYSYARMKIGDVISAGGWGMTLSRPLVLPLYDLIIQPGIGFGRVWGSQLVPGTIIQQLSGNYSEEVTSSAWQLLAGIETIWDYKKFSLHASLNYSTAHLESWGYRKEITKTTSEGEEYQTSTRVTIDNSLLPYQELSFPITFEVGLAYSYPASGNIAARILNYFLRQATL